MDTLSSSPDIRSKSRNVLMILVVLVLTVTGAWLIAWFWSKTPTAIRGRQAAAMARIEARGRKVRPHQPRNEPCWEEGGVLIDCSVDFGGANITDEDLRVLDDLQAGVDLNLAGTGITGKGIEILRRLKASHITSLDLSGTKITDEALVSIEDLRNLSSLNLSNTQVTDAEMGRLAKQDCLCQLRVSRTRLGDEGLKHICEMFDSLSPLWEKDLDLSATNVSDAGLIHLRGLALNQLDLSDTQITDAGLQTLETSGGIRFLLLSNTQIADKGLESLSAIKRLDAVDLRRTSITDAGLPQLKKSTALRYIDVTGSKMTRGGIDDLKKSLPHLEKPLGP
jgi:internalin A